MGYSFHVEDAAFAIDASRKTRALAAVKALRGRFSWVEPAEFTAARTLEDMLEVWGWDAEVTSDGHVTGIDFAREKIGDEDVLFAALAPFVKAGSYIEALGEDGERWRWVFDGERCAVQRARVVWDAPLDRTD